jgi:hypothetical protein
LVFGSGPRPGIAASAGHWYWRMWSVFGNPLFPQFNQVFHGPLAAPIGIGDTGWVPKGVAEKLLWPFIIAYHPERTIEIPLAQILWPMLYLAFVALAVRALRARVLAQPQVMAPPVRFFLVFFALSYLGWLNLFGIYRYLVPIELLAPLALWLVAHGLMRSEFARGAAGYGLVLALAAALPLHSWGHADWARRAFGGETPAFAHPEDSMVFTVHGDPPMGWLVPLFPDRLAFVALGSGFPESPAFAQRVADMMAARRGPVYVMLTADRHDPAQPRSSEEQARAAESNRVVLEKGQEILTRYGIVLHADSCRSYPASIGRSRYAYQLCVVTKP